VETFNPCYQLAPSPCSGDLARQDSCLPDWNRAGPGAGSQYTDPAQAGPAER
jgi:hypothetical protein